jgi:hypothetical protein
MAFIEGKKKGWFFGFFFNQLNLTCHPSINVLLGHGKGSRVKLFCGKLDGKNKFSLEDLDFNLDIKYHFNICKGL